MWVNPNEVSEPKRDLHVGGGAGGNFSGAWSTAVDPLVDPALDLSELIERKARDLAHSADDYVRHNPWAAVGLAALAALTAGYFISRKF